MKYDNYIRLEILTPVHIGSGDTSDPLDYVLTTENGVDYFCQIDLDAWLEDYPDQEELAEVLDGGNLAGIRKYIADNLDVDIYGRNRSRILSAEIGRKYKQHIADTKSPNQLLIDPALKNPLTGGLIIPGSSIKGAIRTAVIDWCDIHWNLNLKNTWKHEYTQTLERALGSIRDSAFKQLKIGDFEAFTNASATVTAKEKSIKADKKGTPKNDCEVCLSNATEPEPQAVYGRIAIGKQGDSKNTVLSCTMNRQVKNWNYNELMQLVNDFYKKRYEDEKLKFYRQPHFSATRETVILMMDKQFANLTSNQMIMRVGHYSHIESMTITHNKPGGKKGFGKTRTLADGVYPFGWIKLTLCSEEEYRHYQQKKAQNDAEYSHHRQQLRQTKMVQRKQHLQQQMQERQRQTQIEQRRQAQQQDELENPWKKVVRTIETIKTWGDLKQQVIENETLLPFREVQPFAEAVCQQAFCIRKTVKKWGSERDELLVEWFAQTSVKWPMAEKEISATEPLDQAQQAEVDKIATLNDWGAYKTSGINVEELSQPALCELLGKLKQWGCAGKKAKKDKKDAWKKVKQLISKKQ